MKRVPLVAALLVCACTAGPDFTEPASPSAAAYSAADERATPARVAFGQKLVGDWWTLFRSPDLDAVVRQAIAGNQTLAIAQSTLAQARDELRAGQGEGYPQLDANASAEREAVNLAPYGFKGKNPSINLFSVGGTISFDLDVAGGIRRRNETLAALADAAQYRIGAAYLTLTGDVTRAALQIAGINAQIAAVDDIVASDQRNLNLTETARAAGTVTEVDVITARSQLDNDRTLLPPLRQARSVARHALSVFVGRAPSDWSPPDFDLSRLTLPDGVPISLPSALVHERPDILAAEQSVHAATAEVGVAAARLYPDIDLAAAVEQQALQPGQIFSQAFNAWSFGAGLTAPLFHGGTLRAREQGARDALQESVLTYQRVVLQAFGQVADVLQALVHDDEELAEQARALRTAQAALQLAQVSFSEGNSGVLQVLEPQRLYQQAKLGYVRAQAQCYLDTAQLLVATGSGWRGRT